MAAERDPSDLTIPDILPILPLRGTVVFPKAVVPLAAGRPASVQLEALARSVTALFQKVVMLSPTLPDELASFVGTAEGPGALADLIAASLPTLPTTLRQGLLETLGVAERLQRLVAALTKEAE